MSGVHARDEGSPLLTSQKNEVFHRIHAVGLNPAEFRWTAAAVRNVYGDVEDLGDQLTHSPTEFYFQFLDAARADPDRDQWNPQGGPYSVRFSPHRDFREGGAAWVTWNAVTSAVDVWLAALRREYEAPDLWRLLREGQLPTLRSDVEQNEGFTPDEITRVDRSVAELTARVRKERRKLGLSDEEVESVTRSFEELKRIARSADKRQFGLFVVGVLVTLSLQIAYDPERTRQLAQLVAQAFDWLLALGRLLPP